MMTLILVYIVTNGEQIDTVWAGRYEANERADGLNSVGGEMLKWSVVTKDVRNA